MGATFSRSRRREVSVFQSTPPYGGDPTDLVVYPGMSHFNPRPRMGATAYAAENIIGWEISIHAPVWGRPFPIFVPAAFVLFQSTPPYGGDLRQRKRP